MLCRGDQIPILAKEIKLISHICERIYMTTSVPSEVTCESRCPTANSQMPAKTTNGLVVLNNSSECFRLCKANL